MFSGVAARTRSADDDLILPGITRQQRRKPSQQQDERRYPSWRLRFLSAAVKSGGNTNDSRAPWNV